MEVSQKEFSRHDFSSPRYEGLEVISNTDSGLFAVQYNKQKELGKPEIERMYKKSYYSNQMTVEMSIIVPEARTVLRSLVVIKTSANRYNVTYADAKQCVSFIATSYADIHRQLVPLWQGQQS